MAESGTPKEKIAGMVFETGDRRGNVETRRNPPVANPMYAAA
jgi:hypothetical protein